MIKQLFALQALVNILFGIPLIFVTGTLLSIYGLSTDRTGTYLGQFLGATFIGLAWISWAARGTTDEAFRNTIIRASFVTSLIGLVASVIFQLQPEANASTWLFVVLTAIFAAGWGYYSYEAMRPMAKQQPA
jgi:hypothetical protein